MKMKIIRNLLLILLTLLLQTTWMDKIAVAGIKPDCVLLMLVYIGITRGQIEGTIFGFISGFLLDVYNPETMGVNSFCNSLVGFLVGYGHIGVVTEDFRAQALMLFGATLFHDLIYFALYSFPKMEGFFHLLIGTGLGTALYTGLVGLCLSLLLSIRFEEEGIRLDARRLYG